MLAWFSRAIKNFYVAILFGNYCSDGGLHNENVLFAFVHVELECGIDLGQVLQFDHDFSHCRFHIFVEERSLDGRVYDRS